MAASHFTIRYAAESPDLERLCEEFCEANLPDAPRERWSFDQLVDALEGDDDGESLLLVGVKSGDDGSLASNSSTMRMLLDARAPVLVLRQGGDSDASRTALERIVVPLDGSVTAGQAVPVAARFAEMLNLPVQFVMVIDPEKVVPRGAQYDPNSWDIIEELRNTAHWALTHAEHMLRESGVAVSSELLYGPRTQSLVTSIGEGDLVVMASHGSDRSRLRSRQSVTGSVLAAVPQPMVVMRATREPALIESCTWVPDKR